MAGEKRFGSSMFGFNKSDVNYYIEKIIREFDEKLKSKDDEIAALKNQCREIRIKYEELARKADEINEDRAKIASVLIKAQEKAELMLEDARNEALDEKKRLEKAIEDEREKLVDAKEELKNLKSEALKVLRKFESQIEDISYEDEDVVVNLIDRSEVNYKK
ncbi:MAG: DivIVA domain-containing protein [Clostridia bacterium]|nr:DivIVA domain-containing protein [Clostridia bacterium]